VTLPRGRPRRFTPRPRAGTACVLVSGGLDSAVLLRDFARRYLSVQPLYVRAGLRWEKAEIASLRSFLRALQSPRLMPLAFIDVPMADLYGRHWSTTGRRAPGFYAGDASIYLPGRNLALLSKAGTFCALRGIPILGSGILNLNPFPDGTPGFFRAMQETLRRGLGTPIRIRTPFRGLAKDAVIRRGRDLPLQLTLSCANPRRGRHCGRCCKCAERAWAFLRAGVPDRTDYAGGPGAAVPASRGTALRPAVRRARTTRVAPKKTTRAR
jgi:7-cyano-7-deazaguanine synthase